MPALVLQWGCLEFKTNRVYAGANAAAIDERRNGGQQPLDVQGVRCASRSGATIFVVESQGWLPEVPKNPGGKQFRLAARFQERGSGAG